MKKVFIAIAVVMLTIGVARASEQPVETAQGKDNDVEVLDRNIRLDFRLVPEEENDKPAFIVTAVSTYETSARFKNEDKRVMLSVSGGVEKWEGNKILVLLNVELAFSGDEQEAEFYVSSGVLLEPGEECEVARMGERTLVVRASYPDKSESKK